MKVIINTSNTAFVTPGGGEIQILETFNELKKLDTVDVKLYDMWHPELLKCDMVHYFSVQFGSGVFCDYIKNLGIKLVVSPIIWIEENNNYNLDEIKHILEIADFILPNSYAEVDMLNKELNIPKDKMLPVYNGISREFSVMDQNFSFKERYGLDQYILNVANIEPRKNQLNLIKAIQNLGIKLVLIGAIRDKEYFNKCLEADWNNLVKYIGRLSHDSIVLKSAYKEAECFVLPSTLETPGLAALEALVCGCPHIVVTSIGSAQEYFEDKVQYISEIHDVCKIEEAITKALIYPKIEESFIEKIKNKFSWEKTALQTLKAYEIAMNYVKPDIFDKSVVSIEGFYDLEYDGKSYFRWMQKKAKINIENVNIKVKLSFVADRGQYLYIKHNNQKTNYVLEEGLNTIEIISHSSKINIELESIKKLDLPTEENRYLTIRFLKIESF